MMDKDYKDTLSNQEHVPVPKRVYITRENLDELSAYRCSGGLCDSHTLRNVDGTWKQNRREQERQEAAQRRTKEYMDRATEIDYRGR